MTITLRDIDLTAIADTIQRNREEWMGTVLAMVLPPEMFLRAYGNRACKIDVMNFLKDNGFELRLWPDGKEELMHGEQVLSTWHPYRINPSSVA